MRNAYIGGVLMVFIPILVVMLMVFLLVALRHDEIKHNETVVAKYQECKVKVGGTADGVEWCFKTLKPYLDK